MRMGAEGDGRDGVPWGKVCVLEDMAGKVDRDGKTKNE